MIHGVHSMYLQTGVRHAHIKPAVLKYTLTKHICTYMRTNSHMNVYTCTNTHACIHTCTNTHVCMHARTHTHTHAHTKVIEKHNRDCLYTHIHCWYMTRQTCNIVNLDFVPSNSVSSITSYNTKKKLQP